MTDIRPVLFTILIGAAIVLCAYMWAGTEDGMCYRDHRAADQTLHNWQKAWDADHPDLVPQPNVQLPKEDVQ